MARPCCSLVEAYPNARFHWIVFSGDAGRATEARASAEAFLAGATDRTVEVHRFRESYFPYVAAEVKDAFEDIKGRVEPDVVFTHCLEDRHQDHRLISELTHNTYPQSPDPRVRDPQVRR